MRRKILSRQSLLAVAAGSMLVASTAFAQDRLLLKWTGRVDKEVQLTIRDTTVTTSIVGGQPVTRTYFDVKDRMPQRDGAVRVQLDAGRGDVDVVQEPTAKNDYAAVVRIRDKSSGKDTYALTVFWNPQSGEDRYTAAAATAHATAGEKPMNTLHWSGSVDAEAKIEWRGFDAMTTTPVGETAREVHSSVTNALPATASRVELIVRQGRGDVTIIQQPSSTNGFTAILRVRDPQTGFGHYDFDVNWR